MGDYVFAVIPRRKHRPDCYTAEGDAQYIISPGALDMAGLIITPRKEDFERLDADTLHEIISEVGITTDIADEIAHETACPSAKNEEQKPILKTAFHEGDIPMVICLRMSFLILCQLKERAGYTMASRKGRRRKRFADAVDIQ